MSCPMVSHGCPKWRCLLGSQCQVSVGGCPYHTPLHIHGLLIGAEGAGHLTRLMQTSQPRSTSSHHHHPGFHCQVLVPPALIPQSTPTALVCQQHEVPLGSEMSLSFWGASVKGRDLERARQGGTWRGGAPEWGSAENKQDRLAECRHCHVCHHSPALPRALGIFTLKMGVTQVFGDVHLLL